MRYGKKIKIVLAVALLLGIFSIYQSGQNIFVQRSEDIRYTLSPTPIATFQQNSSHSTPTPTTETTSKKMTESQTIPSPTPTSTCGLGQPTPITPDRSVRIDSVSPTSGKTGDVIIITGSGFGKSSFYYSNPRDFSGMVSFYGLPCGYNSGGAPPAVSGDWDYSWWADNQVKVKVPGVSSGDFQVEVTSSDGKRSNRINFRVLP